MDTLKKALRFTALFLVGACPVLMTLARVPIQRADKPGAPTLFAQAVTQTLDRELGTRQDVSFLLLDAESGDELAKNWRDAGSPIPVGSLVKPFTALAYASSHTYHYPIYECRGKATACWQPKAHGTLNISRAVAVSCNSYFRSLAENVSVRELLPITGAYGIEAPSQRLTTSTLIGLGEDWKIDPKSLTEAYLELHRRADQPGVREILDGMRLSATEGTGTAIGRAMRHSGALVKTGTALCTHGNGGAADGFVVTLIPAENPQVILLLRAHGVAGAQAATVAARVLAKVER